MSGLRLGQRSASLEGTKMYNRSKRVGAPWKILYGLQGISIYHRYNRELEFGGWAWRDLIGFDENIIACFFL